MMDLHKWLTFENTTRTHQGAEGPPRELPSLLPFFTSRSLFARRERALWRHLLATYKKENCTSRPRPIGTNTSTEATSSAEATSILDVYSVLHFSLSVYRGSWRMYRYFVPVIAQHNIMASLWHCTINTAVVYNVAACVVVL